MWDMWDMWDILLSSLLSLISESEARSAERCDRLSRCHLTVKQHVSEYWVNLIRVRCVLMRVCLQPHSTLLTRAVFTGSQVFIPLRKKRVDFNDPLRFLQTAESSSWWVVSSADTVRRDKTYQCHLFMISRWRLYRPVPCSWQWDSDTVSFSLHSSVSHEVHIHVKFKLL